MDKKGKKICYLCHGSDFEKIKGVVRDNRHIRVYKCKNCSLISLETTEHINENFYKLGKMHNSKFNPDNWEKNSYPDDFRRFNFLKKQIKNKILVDFGCGAGGFLKMAREVCDKVYGIELDEKLNTRLVNQGLAMRSNINDVNEKVDFITMFHVLEHIEKPIELLQEFKNKLSDENSQIIIEVPNGNDALITLYKSKAFSHFTWWSCHLYTYNRKNIQTLVEKAGYRVNYIKNVQRYGIYNHLYWLLRGKPGGHIKFAWAKFSVLEYFYAKILSLFNKNDTIIISISPI